MGQTEKWDLGKEIRAWDPSAAPTWDPAAGKVTPSSFRDLMVAEIKLHCGSFWNSSDHSTMRVFSFSLTLGWAWKTKLDKKRDVWASKWTGAATKIVTKPILVWISLIHEHLCWLRGFGEQSGEHLAFYTLSWYCREHAELLEHQFCRNSGCLPHLAQISASLCYSPSI